LRPKDETLSNAAEGEHGAAGTGATYVVVGLVRAVGGKAKVVGLDGGHLGQLDVELGQVGTSDLLIEGLGEHASERQRGQGRSGDTYWTPRGYFSFSVQRAI
jgi:hypothetical protein